MANVTYKHLEGRTVVGLLSLSQWVQLIAGVVFALLFAIYLSPLPVTLTIFVACLLPGLPLAGSYGAMGLEFSVSEAVAAAWRYWRRPRRYMPGPGSTATGYVVMQEAEIGEALGGGHGGVVDDLEALWDV